MHHTTRCALHQAQTNASSGCSGPAREKEHGEVLLRQWVLLALSVIFQIAPTLQIGTQEKWIHDGHRTPSH